MNHSRQAYAWLLDNSVKTAHLASLAELAAWDQRTGIPRKGHAHRIEQMAVAARLVHDLTTDPKVGECLSVLEQSGTLVLDSVEATNVRMWRRQFDLQVKIPTALAVELARACAHGESVWEDAVGTGDYERFRPCLETLLRLTGDKADCLRGQGPRYDALLDEYEPEATSASVGQMFAALRGPLITLRQRISESPVQPAPMTGPFPIAAQRAFCREMVAAIGYDLEAGRIDEAVHPFSVGIGPGDVRITTRYSETSLESGLFGCLHEAGHAMYDQGLVPAHFGTPAGTAVSLGIHESQSRLWENAVGRSASFWAFAWPRAVKHFDALSGVSPEEFFRSINRVSAGRIRVEADEVTYNLHVLLRFELEKALFEGDLTVGDLPGAWNGKMAKYLGVQPTGFADGVMQDVHWSAGLFGYFPTYTLGNLYAAQLYAAAERSVGPMAPLFAKGKFGPLKQWLNDSVHVPGQRFTPGRLVQEATGTPPDAKWFLNYLEAKYAGLYAL